MARRPLDNAMLELIGAPSHQSTVPADVPVLSASAGMPFLRQEAYEGAGFTANEVALWTPSLGSADVNILPEKRTADARVRDSFRNDAYVMAGGNLHRDGIVGALYLLNATPMSRLLGPTFDETWEAEFQEEVEDRFTLIAESNNHWLDASRINTHTSLIRLLVGVYAAAGEVLFTSEWIDDPQRPCGTAVQVVDLDRLSNPDNQPNTPTLRGGIKYDSYGAPQGYYIRRAHPVDFYDPDSMVWDYVPIRTEWGRIQACHIFEQTSPWQSRGISELVSALKEMRTTKRFRETRIQKAILNAMFAATIQSEMPDDVFGRLGENGRNATFAGTITDYAKGYLGAVDKYAGGKRALTMNGARVPRLFPGEKLNIFPAAGNDNIGGEFEQSLLRYMAASFNVSYEQFSRDYTNTNYSSARASLAEVWKFFQSRKRMVADRAASTNYMLWLEEMISRRKITSMPRVSKSWLRDLGNLEALAKCEWIGATRGQIDELKETEAAAMRIEAGLSTWQDEAARLGKDYRRLIRQQAREKALMEKLGVSFNISSSGTQGSQSSQYDQNSSNDTKGNKNADA